MPAEHPVRPANSNARITSLARTAIERGLAHAAELRSDDIEVAHAMAALDSE